MPHLAKAVSVYLEAVVDGEVIGQRHTVFAMGAALPADTSFKLGSWSLPSGEFANRRIELFQGKSHRLARFDIPGRRQQPSELRFLLDVSGRFIVWCDDEAFDPGWVNGNQVSLTDAAVTAPLIPTERTKPLRPSLNNTVFVSHAASDAQTALKIVEAIERTGRLCWIAPRDVRAGRDFREEIVTAIEQCGFMIVLMSKSANESLHVLRELGLAEQYEKIVKPVRLDNSKLTRAFDYQLQGLHWIPFEPSFAFVKSLVAD